MDNELTNLLPEERQRIISRDYFLRMSVVAVILITILIFVSALLLLPTYVFLTKSAAAKETSLASIESILSSSDEKDLSARLASLSSNAALLVAQGNAPSISAIMRNALAVPRPGITLSSFAYTPATLKSPGTLGVSGTAVTRDALRSYQIALESAPFAVSANLPVSAYAKDADIDFTITMTLAP